MPFWCWRRYNNFEHLRIAILVVDLLGLDNIGWFAAFQENNLPTCFQENLPSVEWVFLFSQVFAERLGLETGWNCHISLGSCSMEFQDSMEIDTTSVVAERDPLLHGSKYNVAQGDFHHFLARHFLQGKRVFSSAMTLVIRSDFCRQGTVAYLWPRRYLLSEKSTLEPMKKSNVW